MIKITIKTSLFCGWFRERERVNRNILFSSTIIPQDAISSIQQQRNETKRRKKRNKNIQTIQKRATTTKI